MSLTRPAPPKSLKTISLALADNAHHQTPRESSRNRRTRYSFPFRGFDPYKYDKRDASIRDSNIQIRTLHNITLHERSAFLRRLSTMFFFFYHFFFLSFFLFFIFFLRLIYNNDLSTSACALPKRKPCTSVWMRRTGRWRFTLIVSLRGSYVSRF